jgi:hypothetical protein
MQLKRITKEVNKNHQLTAADVGSILEYDPRTGFLHWAEGQRLAGKVAGSYSAKTVTVTIGCLTVPAHHVVWLLTKGEWPSQHLEHINGNKVDNRLENLREVAQRPRRKSTGKSSKFMGVSWSASSKKWVAYIRANGKVVHLGTFRFEQNAHRAYMKAKSELSGGV